MARGRFLLGLLSGAVLTGAVGAGGLDAFGGVIGPMLIGAPAIPKPPPVAASQASREMLADAAARVAADDRQDFADAERGYIATLADPLIRNDKGEVVFDLSSYDFLKESRPRHRQSQPVAARADHHQARSSRSPTASGRSAASTFRPSASSTRGRAGSSSIR